MTSINSQVPNRKSANPFIEFSLSSIKGQECRIAHSAIQRTYSKPLYTGISSHLEIWTQTLLDMDVFLQEETLEMGLLDGNINSDTKSTPSPRLDKGHDLVDDANRLKLVSSIQKDIQSSEDNRWGIPVRCLSLVADNASK